MRKLLLSVVSIAAVIGIAIGAVQANALPVAPSPAPPVTGIPTPCISTNPWPEDASIAEIKQQIEDRFHFTLAGDHWTQEYRPSIKILWQTLDAVSCTGFVETLQSKVSGTVGISATGTSGWSWGDWSLSRPGYVSLDFEKFQSALANDDEGRLVRLVIHELSHVYNADRYESPSYWAAFQKLHRKAGRFSEYAGGSVTETFADTVGYYVGRCALHNPYDSGKHGAYYAFVRDNVFHGKEFGPAPGTTPNCSQPKDGAQEPRPGLESDGPAPWISDLVGE